MRLLALGLAIAALTAVTAAAATVPKVAIIRPDLLPAGDPNARPLANARFQAVADALRAGGVPWVEATDSSVAKSGLPDVPVAASARGETSRTRPLAVTLGLCDSQMAISGSAEPLSFTEAATLNTASLPSSRAS